MAGTEKPASAVSTAGGEHGRGPARNRPSQADGRDDLDRDLPGGSDRGGHPSHALAAPRPADLLPSGALPRVDDSSRLPVAPSARLRSQSKNTSPLILLDCSPGKIADYTEHYDYPFGQLRTPLTNYSLADDIPWAADNGFFSRPDVEAWERWVDRFDENRARRPLFVTLPDIVCDAQRTLELFEYFKLRTNELPRALVLQNGIDHCQIPWADVDAVFIGGDDDFKFSAVAIRAAKTAKALGRWVHVGRVNTAARVRNWIGLADSIDGSGLSRFDHMLEDVLSMIRGEHPQAQLLEAAV